jgi:hypothetical protein
LFHTSDPVQRRPMFVSRRIVTDEPSPADTLSPVQEHPR